jgi:hypothetical protein
LEAFHEWGRGIIGSPIQACLKMALRGVFASEASFSPKGFLWRFHAACP